MVLTLAKVNADAASAINTLTSMVGDADKANVNYNAHLKDTADSLAKAKLAADAFLTSLDTAGDKGAFEKASDQWLKNIDTIVAKYDALIKAGDSVADAQAFMSAAFDKNDVSLNRQNDAILASIDVTDKLNAKFEEEISGLKGVGVEQDIEHHYLKDLEVAQTAWTAAMGTSIPMTDEYKASIHALSAEHAIEIDNAKEAAQIEKQWEGIATSGFNSVGSAIAEFRHHWRHQNVEGLWQRAHR